MKNLRHVVFLSLAAVVGCGQQLVQLPLATPPTVLFTDPANGATGVLAKATVGVAFDKAIDCTTLTPATFTLKAGSASVAGGVTCSDSTATFTPTHALALGSAFTAAVTTGVKDPFGNALAADHVWRFATVAPPDVTPPIVSFTNPAKDASGVNVKTNVQVAFDEPMNCKTLDTSTFTLTHGAAPVAGTVTCVGADATFAPAAVLALDTGYTATVTTGVQDTSGNALTANYIWKFTTSPTALPDTTPPTVTFTNPAAHATGVSANTAVEVAFDQTMTCTTLNAATFTLMQGATTVPGTVTCAGTSATFTPTGTLVANAGYTATVTTGATSQMGVALAANYAWTFTTGAFAPGTAPIVTFTDPTNGATGVDVATTVEAAFDETMDCATLDATTFLLMQGATPVPGTVACSGAAATFTPTNALIVGVAYTATVTTGAMDQAGNALAANYVWSFSTGAFAPGTPPTVTFTDPANGANGVNVGTTVQVAFDEPMDCTTLDALTFTLAQGATSVPGVVSCAGSSAVLTPTSPLADGVSYTATVTTGAKDLAGTALTTAYVWTFETGNEPMVISTSPTNGAENVAINRDVDATFGIAMDPLTVNSTTFTVSQGATPIVGTVSYAGTTATFTPTANYPLNVVLTATITTGAQDVGGAPLLADYVWTFQTGAQVGLAPVQLGAASTYAILAFNTVTNVNNPGTVVTGDLGISPGSALIGFPPGQVVGATHLGDPTAAAAKASLLAAYNDAAGRLNPAVLPGDLSGLTFAPGLYKSSTSVMLSAGNFTLDAKGDSGAVFIFQIGSTLTTMPGTHMVLSGGAKATNIYWAVGTSATLGTTSIFKGTILAASAITASTGATVEGRLLAQAAAVSLDTNLITVPAP